MKLLIQKRKQWLNRQVRSKWQRSVKLAGAMKRLRIRKPKRLRCCILVVPKLLIGEKLQQRLQILRLVDQIDSRLRSGGYRVKLDFSRVEKIFPGGMLILLAALQRLTADYPHRISASCPPHSLASQLLNHFGFASMLGVNLRTSEPKASSVLGWSYLTGTQAAGAEVKDLLDQYRNNTSAEIPEGLFAVLTEGLTNVRHHAYPARSTMREEFRKWWLFARYDEPCGAVNGSLFIAIYDMGVGIPGTMRTKLEAKEVVLDLIDTAGKLTALTGGTALDQRLLLHAIEHKRSQTGQPHRGNGLPEMREFINSSEAGRLHIVSGHAQYSFIKGKSDGHVDGFKQEFPGTLLLWGLPLKAKEVLS
jgi:hypothetical protein